MAALTSAATVVAASVAAMIASAARGDIVYSPLGDVPIAGLQVDVDGDGLADVALSMGAESSVVAQPLTHYDDGCWAYVLAVMYGMGWWGTSPFFAAGNGASPIEGDPGTAFVGWRSEPVRYINACTGSALYLPVCVYRGDESPQRCAWIELRYDTSGPQLVVRAVGTAVASPGEGILMGDRGCTFGPPALNGGGRVVVAAGDIGQVSVTYERSLSVSAVWRRNGVVLPDVGHLYPLYPGNGDATIWLYSAQAADAGVYTVEVTGPCGVSVSDPIEVLVTPAADGRCLADVGATGGVAGQDGALDNNDLVAFIGGFFSESPVADMGAPGAIGAADGRFDNNDFIVFIDRFFAGC